MNAKPKFTFTSVIVLVLSISLLPLLACNTAIGRAIGGEGDGGAFDIPPVHLGIVYTVAGELNSPAPDIDEWTFQGIQGELVEIRMVTAPGAPGVDTYLVLNGPNGQQVAMNDDYESLHAGINMVLTDSGEYTIDARGYGNSTGLYELTLKFTSTEASEASDGGPIAEDTDGDGVSNSYGVILVGSEEDVWEIPALAGDNLLIVLDGISYLDPTLTLLDPDGSQVAYNDDAIGRDSQISYTAVSDGVYLAVARGYGGTSNGDYWLNVTGNSDRAAFNDITENLERAEAELEAANELAAAAVVTELIESAEVAEVQAATELAEAEQAAAIAEEAERNSAQADVALDNAEQAESEAEQVLQELAETSDQLDEMVVQDIAQLDEIAAEADAAAEANRIAEQQAAEAEAELVRLREAEAESTRIAAAAEARAQAEREEAAAEAAAEATRLEEARTLERIQRNAEEAARMEAEAEVARRELAAREMAAVQAELAALAASIAEEQAEQELAEQAREAAEAEVAAAVAAEAARNAAGESSLATIIAGGYVDVSSPQFGTASVVDGQIYYVHDGSPNPLDTFSATVRGADGQLFEVRMSVELSFVRPNTAPVAVDDYVALFHSVNPSVAGSYLAEFVTLAGRGYYWDIVDVIANDTDADGDELTVTHINGLALTPGSNFAPPNMDYILCDPNDPDIVVDFGTECSANRLVVASLYTPNYNGTEAFTYTVQDGGGLSSTGTVTVTMTSDYVLPNAWEQNISISQGSESTHQLTGLSGNQRIESVTDGQRGSIVSVVGRQSITIQHNGRDDSGFDSFHYTIVDQLGAEARGSVQVTVEVLNQRPTPAPFAMTVEEGRSVEIPVIPSASDDWDPQSIDPEGDSLIPTSDDSGFHRDPNANHPTNGSYVYQPVMDAAGSTTGYNLIYTHDGSETLWDSFDYELRQADGQTGWGRIDITVLPLNDIPYAANYSLTLEQGGSINLDVVNSESDPDGPALSVDVDITPEQGDLTLVGSTFTYTHSGDNTSPDYFEYSLDDGLGHSVPGTVVINIWQASLDVSAVALPAPGQSKVAWDPEIGVRISSTDSLDIRNLDLSFSVWECPDSLCEDSQIEQLNRQVSGRTVQLSEPASQILSFIPDVPLYGDTSYKVYVNQYSGVELTGGNIQDLSSLIGDITSWTFTTAEMTRFTLPMLITYSDSQCRGAQEVKVADRVGESLCLTLEDIDNLLYGMEEDTPGHYLDVMSDGKFAISPVRDRAGHVIKSIQIDRDKPYIGGNCGRGWEKDGQKPLSVCPDFDQDTSLTEEMDQRVDRLRYRNLYHKDGSYNLLAPYRPSREEVIDTFGLGTDWDITGNGQHHFRNITPIFVWGVGGPDTSPNSVIGMASPPVWSQGTELDISHEEAHRTWGHELGHAYFGLPDYYHRGKPAGPNKTGPLDIMGDRLGGNEGKQWPPLTAWSLIKSEFQEPEQLFTDTDLLAVLGDASALIEGPGSLSSRENENGANIIKIPAIIERDTQLVKGYYLLELYGSTGYDGQIYVNSNTVNFADNPGAFPGGIAIWKWDTTEQKIRERCATWSSCTGYEFLYNNGNITDLIEYYPSIPSVTPGNDEDWPGSSPGIYNLFPWWYSAQVPYGADYENDLSNMPTTIELPVLEIAPAAEDPNYGGGNKVATVTLSFADLVEDIKSGIQSASANGNIGNFGEYTFGDTAAFTYSVEKHAAPEYMTYKDHVREGQIQFASGEMWDEMQAYGFFRFTEPAPPSR